MAYRPAKPEGMPWIIPYLTVHDCEGAMEFYEKAFGFQRGGCEPIKGPDGQIVHAEMKYRDGMIMMGLEGALGCDAKTPANSEVVPPMGLYLYCENVDALAHRATSAGAQMICEPTDMFWGDRMTALVDPDGYRWSFATNVGEMDLSKMPAMAAT